ncbi:hypothetical protein ACF0H5_000253 [Mactra antiquata]
MILGLQHDKDLASKGTQIKPGIMYVWRAINCVMTVFFLLAAYVNMNDPDWYIWGPIYLVPGLLSLAVTVQPTTVDSVMWSSSTVIHFTLCCAYTFYQIVLLMEAIGNKMENPLQHEAGREMGGLLIIITWLGISRFTNIGRPNAAVTSKGMMSALLLMSVTLTLLPLFLWSLCFISDWHTRIGHCSGMFK